MGSPLYSVLANMYTDLFENEIVDKSTSLCYYSRFVVGTFGHMHFIIVVWPHGKKRLVVLLQS